MIGTTLFGANIIKPTKSFDAGGAVVDIVKNKQKLYVSTSESIVTIFNLKTFDRVDTITLPKI